MKKKMVKDHRMFDLAAFLSDPPITKVSLQKKP